MTKHEHMYLNPIRGLLYTTLLMSVLAYGLLQAEEPAKVSVSEQNRVATIENSFVRVSYDLATGLYSAADRKREAVIIASACSRAGEFSSTAPGTVNTVTFEPLADPLGMGRSLLIASAVPQGPKLLLRISLYEDQGFIALCAGLENNTDKVLRVKELVPLDAGVAFKGFDTQTNYSTLDGHGGGQKTYVSHEGRKRKSLNNLLVTFGALPQVHSLVMGGLGYVEFEKCAEATRGPDGALAIKLWAEDPIGKRVDPGTRYLVANDRFHVDFLTANPFDALEAYVERLRLAQEVVLPVCRFPIVDTWCAQVPHFGGGEDRAGYRAQNDSVGAVEEMECVARSGFLKYSPVAVLLEPDLYDANNQQGWWDDEHWQRGPSNRAKGAGSWVSSHGQFVPPYETVRKWAGAVKALGGIPMIYMQTGFRSQDYAEAFPGHMVFNEPNVPHLNEKGEQLYRDKEKKIPRKLGYDYTDPAFIRHMREVWENLRLAGVQGCKFDYPDFPFTGWPTRGGLEDPYATTAMHYRNIFELAKAGLGSECFLHERTLDRGSDIALGLTTSQRTEGDTDKIDKTMICRNALRWYKNRVVVNYDMDAKNPFHAVPENRDGIRSVLTMSYLVAGTLMIAPSFGRMTPEMLHDLSCLYPSHANRQSARPLDAFTNELPQVYDFKVNSSWHQLTFCNHDTANKATVSVNLAGATAAGALGLDTAKRYYVYDFWNDGLIGKFPGTQRFEQTLRPGEARMMSIHEVAAYPQFLSTNRHLMQGCVDMLGCDWDAAHKQLRGVSAVVGGETYKVIIATNSHKPTGAAAYDSIEQSIAKSRVAAAKTSVAVKLKPLPDDSGLIELSIDRSDNGPVAWGVTFE